jgi:hypothetical protein
MSKKPTKIAFLDWFSSAPAGVNIFVIVAPRSVTMPIAVSEKGSLSNVGGDPILKSQMLRPDKVFW